MVIVPSRVHFCLRKGEFEAGRGKNTNFREVKREGEKRGFGCRALDYCRMQGVIGADKGIFAGFHHQSKLKNER